MTIEKHCAVLLYCWSWLEKIWIFRCVHIINSTRWRSEPLLCCFDCISSIRNKTWPWSTAFYLQVKRWNMYFLQYDAKHVVVFMFHISTAALYDLLEAAQHSNRRNTVANIYRGVVTLWLGWFCSWKPQSVIIACLSNLRSIAKIVGDML